MSSATLVNEPNEVVKDHIAELKSHLKQIKLLETMDKSETLRLRSAHVGPSCTLFFSQDPLKMVSGRGQYLYDEAGNEYLDCINNVSHIGHANKRVQEAVSKQLGLVYTNSRFLHDNLSLYAKRLTSLFPAHLSVCYLVNSGSEANDLAMRLARAHTRNKDIVTLDGAYHGNLTSIMAISPYKTDHIIDYKQPKWVHVAPLPSAYRAQEFNETLPKEHQEKQLSADDSKESIARMYVQATKRMIRDAKSRGRRFAAMYVESMISCGAQSPMPEGYLLQMQKAVHDEGALFICDEVQTGFGRCGKHMWAFQLGGPGVKPDIVTMGKPMGNGFPVSAVVTTPEIARSFHDIGTEYFNTFGGNAASCAAALAVLDELDEHQLMREADRIGSYMLRELQLIKADSKSQIVGDVRGEGFFIGVEMIEDPKSRRPAPYLADAILHRFRQERILMSTEGKHGNILKFKPPMVFTMDNAKRFLQVLRSAIVELDAKVLAQRKTSQISDSSELPSSSSSNSSLDSSCDL